MRGREERDGLDELTVERLLSGDDMRDAGEDVRRLGTFLAAAREPLPVDPVRAESDRMAVMEAFRELHGAGAPDRSRPHRRRLFTGALAGMAALLTAGGVAVASGGVAVPGFLGGDPRPVASQSTPATTPPGSPALGTPSPSSAFPDPTHPSATPRGNSGDHRADRSADLCHKRADALAQGRGLGPGEANRLAEAAKGRPVGPYCADILRAEAAAGGPNDKHPQTGRGHRVDKPDHTAAAKPPERNRPGKPKAPNPSTPEKHSKPTPTKPSLPAKPSTPQNPAAPGKPGNSKKAGQPGRTGGSDKAGQPGNAGGSEKAGEPGRAGGPEKAGQPGKAGGSEKAGQPGGTGGSDKAGRPGNAGGSEKAGEPGKAGGSERAAEPSTAGGSAKTEESRKADGPRRTEGPGTTDAPEKPAGHLTKAHAPQPPTQTAPHSATGTTPARPASEG
ncbi:hypothetical protein AB0M28_12845 [Streptomyces sp. NPDC051940]|uniref:hypothetical protein n=1 Tax=Streptomyces sp. NPDC051940 TaxID=3155675 RepID=UPI0034184891